MSAPEEMVADPLWHRHWDIVDRRWAGLYMPVLWHAALRRRRWAMLELSGHVAEGRRSDRFSRAGLCQQVFRYGDAMGGTYLARDAFNRGDMRGYRYWVVRAGRAGDREAAAEAGRFETRLPHAMARRVGRLRPCRRGE